MHYEKWIGGYRKNLNELDQKFPFDIRGGVSYIPKSLLRIGQMVVPGKKHWETPLGSISFFLMAFFYGQTPDLPRILSKRRVLLCQKKR